MKPTYLYIKEHSITGIRYFGKTTKSDPYKYKGSGKEWTNHIKIHGNKHIKTIWVSEPFTDESRLIEFATFMSEELDIVKSDKWANLIIENGIGGSANNGKTFTDEWRKNLSKSHIGNIPGNKGKIGYFTHNDETKKKMSELKRGRAPWNKGKTGLKYNKRKGNSNE